MMEKYGSMWDGHLGRNNVAKQCIVLNASDPSPIRLASYHVGPKEHKFYHEEIEKMCEVGVAEPPVAEWFSPVVFIPKKNGSLQFCVDYSRLNAVAERESYLNTRMNECIDSLVKTKIFWTPDDNSSYWQIEMGDMYIHKKHFITHRSPPKCMRTPYGLKNATATFQRAMDVRLVSAKRQHAVIHINKIIFFSKTPEEHLRHISETPLLLKNAEMTIKLKKCCFLS